MIETKRHLGQRSRLGSVDWVSLRKAFIERPERPLYDDLAKEFGCSVPRIMRASQDEGWPAMRAAHLEEALKSSDAAVALLRAAKADSAVTHAVSNLALEVIAQLHDVTAKAAAAGKAENTRANTLNTVTFALRNLTGALKDVGIVGIPKALKESAGVDLGNGRWNPQMLQSLNVTVQNLVAAAPQVDGNPPSRPAAPPVEAAPAPALAAPVEGLDPFEAAAGERSETTVTEPAPSTGGTDSTPVA